jgi:hypothetical protein
MPELAEIHLFSSAVNEFVAGKVFHKIEYTVAATNSMPHLSCPFSQFYIVSEPRGKGFFSLVFCFLFE